MQIAHRGAGGPDPGAAAAGPPGSRWPDGTELTAARGAVRRRPEADLPAPGRQGRAARGLPGRGGRDQDGRPVRQGQPGPGRRAAGARACPRTPGPAGGRCSPCRRTWPSPTPATTGPSAASWPTPTQLFVDCVVASNVDDSLAPPGRHIMTCFVQYVPYRLAEGTWDGRRDELGDRVLARIGQFAPNVPGGRGGPAGADPAGPGARLRADRGQHLPRRHQRRTSCSTCGRCRAGRGTPRRSRGLYLCGAGAHPGGGVTGAPGYNAAHRVLADLRRAGRRAAMTPSAT